jgi:hypothetical protein
LTRISEGSKKSLKFLKGYYLLTRISEGSRKSLKISEGVKKIADNFRGGREIPEYFRWGKEKFGNFREKISAFWYAGADSLNVCLSDESSAMCFSVN